MSTTKRHIHHNPSHRYGPSSHDQPAPRQNIYHSLQERREHILHLFSPSFSFSNTLSSPSEPPTCCLVKDNTPPSATKDLLQVRRSAMTTIIDIDMPPRAPPRRRYSVFSFVGDPEEDLSKFGADIIILPPLKTKIANLNYECDIVGLRTYGCYFDNNIQALIPQLLKDETGHLSAYQPILNTKGPKYWRAQAAFRGANHRAPLWDLMAYFKRHPNLPMLPGIREVQTELVEQYKANITEERERRWRIKSMDDKALADPHRFIRETFADTSDVEVVVVKVGYRFTLHAVASGRDLHHISTDAPLYPDGTQPKPSRWIIIGRTYEAVGNKLKEIQDEYARVKSKIEIAKKIKEEKVAAEKRRVDRLLAIDSARAGLWENCHLDPYAPPLDILGKWVITPLHVDRSFGNSAKKCTMFLVHCMMEDGTCHMWADFDFVEFQGMFKFERPDFLLYSGPPNSVASSVATSPDRLVISSDDDDDDNDMDYNDGGEHIEDEPENEPGEESIQLEDANLLLSDEATSLDDAGRYFELIKSPFNIGQNIRPTYSLPTWDFRWRGRSTDGTLHVGSGAEPCTLRFMPTGPDSSCELKGRFYSDVLGDFEFVGTKLFKKPRLAPFPDNPFAAIHQWDELAPPKPTRGRPQ